jgi:diaminohydroxyphosphoribosylaminopyrimidine deaminase/5-amino-6-(5-phosphoribosylamino)uracil reductase
MEDPNPQVAGRGFAKLRAAGIQVDVGLGEAEARKLNEGFAKYIRTGLPLVTLKSAMTLDGKIAPPAHITTAEQKGAQRSQWITSGAARAHVQQLRHQHDAVLVGVGTVMADDPLLTDRSGLLRRRKLLRVILDSYLRTPLASRLVQTADHDVLVFYSTAEEHARQALEAKGIRVEQIAPADAEGRPNFAAVVEKLGKLEITSLVIEGGAQVNGTALASDAVDKVFLYFAPRILGEEAVPFTGGEGIGGKVKNLKRFELHRFGEDFAVEGYLRDPYTVE